jgi:hypothetical protein
METVDFVVVGAGKIINTFFTEVYAAASVAYQKKLSAYEL